MNLRPLHDRVIVKRQEKETTTAGGIVLAVGPGKVVDGSLRPLDVKAGDRVLFGKYTGSEVKVDGEDYVIMREEEIFAVIQ